MFTWCIILFLLGIAAFMDTIFNYGNIFRQINSAMFMLISLGLMVRTTIKIKEGKKENYEDRIKNLEMQLRTFTSEKNKEKETADF